MSSDEFEATRKTPFPEHLRARRVELRSASRKAANREAAVGAAADAAMNGLSVVADAQSQSQPRSVSGRRAVHNSHGVFLGAASEVYEPTADPADFDDDDDDDVNQAADDQQHHAGGAQRATSADSVFTGNVSPMTRPSETEPAHDAQQMSLVIGTAGGTASSSVSMPLARNPAGSDSRAGSKRTKAESSRPAVRSMAPVTADDDDREEHEPSAVTDGQSAVLDGDLRVLRAPPRSETASVASVPPRQQALPERGAIPSRSHAPVSRTATSMASASARPPSVRSNVPITSASSVRSASRPARASADQSSLVALAAELDFQGREISQLVGSLVKRQQGQLRELFDEVAAVRVEGHDKATEQRAEFEEAMAAVRDDMERQQAEWADERRRLKETEESKQVLIDCLQSDVDMKSESVKLLTEQLSSVQARLDTANHRINTLTSQLATAESRAKSLAHRATAAESRQALGSTDDVTTASTSAFGGALRPQSSNAPSPAPLSGRCKAPSVVITGFRTSDRIELESLVKGLGGSIVNCPADRPLPDDVTHVVCGSLTPKAIAGILKAGTIVCPREYIKKSAAAKEWLSPSSARAIVGDRDEWLSAFPAVTVARPEDRDPGTREVCGVLEACGIRLAEPNAMSDDGLVQLPPLVNLLNEMKPAFLGRSSRH